jgi:hypothetical protein
VLEQSLSREYLPVRLLGVGASKLTREPVAQGDLFGGEGQHRQIALDKTIDSIRAQFGSGALQRGGSLLGRPAPEGK